jgi:hypothetical protein
MATYEVTYSSMTARYTSVVDADDEQAAKRKMCNKGTFRPEEMRLMSAKEITAADVRKRRVAAQEE